MAQMMHKNMDTDYFIHEEIDYLKPQCEKCFGICCVALYFSKYDGFPTDKSGGTPCPNLQKDFRCAVHGKLDNMGLKGCAAYECFGAGQQVSQITFAGRDWRLEPASADLMFEVFFIMRQLHEMSWHLMQALSYHLTPALYKQVELALNETKRTAQFTPQALKKFDLSAHSVKIYGLLRTVSETVQSEIGRTINLKSGVKKSQMRADYFAKDLRRKDLRCLDLRGACLIAANLQGADLTGADLTGADFRDADLSGANLSRSLFLTQGQLNTAKGNFDTKLPLGLKRPKHWACPKIPGKR